MTKTLRRVIVVDEAGRRVGASSSPPSKQIEEDPFSASYEAFGLIEPPYPFNELLGLLEQNTYHARCCRQKAMDVAGLGFTLRPAYDGAPEAEKAALERWIEQANPDKPFRQVIEDGWMDFEALGNAAWEIAEPPEEPEPGQRPRPVAIYHIPFATLRVHKDGKRYCQIRGTKRRWFVAYGAEGPEGQKYVHKDTGDWHHELPFEDRASSLIHVANYSPLSEYYGVPDIIPAIGAVAGMTALRDYNITFFDNSAVPHYAIVIEGADVDEQVENEIVEFFREKIKGNHHATLILPIPHEGVTVRFERLSGDVREASFRLYRQDNRDEILAAHGMPPYRIGIAEVGSLGGSTAREQTEIYKTGIIKPRQELLEHVFRYKLLGEAVGIKNWYIKFHEIDTQDEKADAEIASTYLTTNVWTVNEVRAHLGQDPVEWGDMPYVLLQAWAAQQAMSMGFGAGLGQIGGLTMPQTMMTASMPTADQLAEMAAELGRIVRRAREARARGVA